MYGVEPTVPMAVKPRMDEPLQLADIPEVAEALLSKAEAMHSRVVMAEDTLRIAQHRDTLRSAKVKGGGRGYLPKVS
jgi:hypothetical protein